MLEHEHNETVEHIFNAVLDNSLIDRALQAIAEYAGVATASYLLVNKLSGQGGAVGQLHRQRGGLPDTLREARRVSTDSGEGSYRHPASAFRADPADGAAP